MPVPTISWQAAQPGFSGASSVPSSAPAQSQSDPIEDMIKNIVQPIDPKLIESAITPIAGPHAMQLPSSMTTPVTPHQDASYDERRVVGAGNARARGIGNSITGVMNALGRVVTAESEVKQGHIRDAATKVITAQQAMDEAQQIHDQAVASGDAETASKMMQTIEQNKAVRDGVFADPKLRKSLVKGFDISYTDPASNKTEEHQAVMQAMKQAKTMQEKRAAIAALRQKQNQTAGTAAGEAFAKSQPQGLSQNTAAIQKLQIAQASQKIQQEAFKDYTTLKASLIRSNATVEASQMRVLGASLMEQSRQGFQQAMQQQRFAQAQKLLGERMSDAVRMVGIRGAQAVKDARQIYSDKQADPLTIYTKNRQAYTTFAQNATKDLQVINALQAQHLALFKDAKGNKLTPNPADVKSLELQMDYMQRQFNADQQSAQGYKNAVNQMSSIFGYKEGSSDADTGTGASDSSAGNSSEQPDSAGSTDFTDPFTYLNEDDSAGTDSN